MVAMFALGISDITCSPQYRAGRGRGRCRDEVGVHSEADRAGCEDSGERLGSWLQGNQPQRLGVSVGKGSGRESRK